MKRRLRRCLAVSTVVGNMLMILVTLSLAAILVAWAGTSFGAFSGGSQLFFAQREQALQERLVIEEVYFNGTANPQQIFIFVRNTGPINLNIVAIYVNGTSACIAASCSTSGSVLAVVNAGTGHGWDSFAPGTTNPDTGCLAPPSGTSIPYVGMAVGAVCEFSLVWPNTVSSPTSCPPNYCPWNIGVTTIFQIVAASGRGNQVAYTARAV